MKISNTHHQTRTGQIKSNPKKICNICGKDVRFPYRRYDKNGVIIEGCVDKSHDKYSDNWHNKNRIR